MSSMQDVVRRWAWRLGRKLYCWARGDLPNEPTSNGEYWLIRWMIDRLSNDDVLIDVGAHRGEWTSYALASAARAGKRVRVLSFEPCSGTRDLLQARFGHDSHVEILPYALSSREGEADFYSNGAGLGTNSLDARSGPQSERVRLITLDGFLRRSAHDRVAMLKIDTEGFDFAVLQGASQSLAEGRIELIQFEYNWRWLLNNASLLDVFRLVEGMPYRLGKLVGDSIVFYEEWHFELDRFFENNYVLVRVGSALERDGSSVRFDESNVARERPA